MVCYYTAAYGKDPDKNLQNALFFSTIVGLECGCMNFESTQDVGS